MTTGATLFSGGEGAGLGMKAAGITHLWGIEYDKKIAGIAQLNGFNVINADILTVSPDTLTTVDFLHASPPCPNFSQAKINGKETEQDIALAGKVCEFIRVISPKYFTLENVWAYRKSKSWLRILDTLFACGYWVAVDNVNFADLGVPQSRRRMIVRAVRGAFVPALLPTVDKHVGWYEAIEDLIPSLEPSEFAPYQKYMASLTDLNTYILNPSRTSKEWVRGYDAIAPHKPCPTLPARSRVNWLMGKLNGNATRFDTRCLIRWQTFPDDCKGANLKILGNAVPPLGMQRIVESLSIP